tara:strand:+ start:370 stop:735 length:366 start_codon:yes stop_codon:yes gene_type:complete
MEQRIEIFFGDSIKNDQGSPDSRAGNAFAKVKKMSTSLARDGWFVHQMVSENFEGHNRYHVQVMVVYRQDADSMKSARRFRQDAERQAERKKDADRIKQTKQNLEHAEELSEFFDDESNFS